MNLYLVVEGNTEAELYPFWIRQFVGNMEQVWQAGDVRQNNFYLLNARGGARLLNVTLPDAMADAQSSGRFDRMLICLDAENLSVDERCAEVEAAIAANVPEGRSFDIQIVVQNACLETWLLGNRRVFSRQPQGGELRDFVRFYNVELADPERMPCHPQFDAVQSFHLAYLRRMLEERNMRYSKSNIRDVMTAAYTEALRERLRDCPEQMNTLRGLFDFLVEIEAASA